MQAQAYTETRRRPTGAKPVTPQTKIQMAFDDAGGDRQVAARNLIEPLLNGDALHDHLLKRGADTAMSNLICSDRADAYRGTTGADVTRAFLKQPNVTNFAAHNRRVHGRASLEVLLLLESTLFGGNIKMGDATKEELLESAGKYETQSQGALHKSLHQRAVAQRVPHGKKTREVLDDAMLTSLWRDTGRGLKSEIAA